MEAKKIQRITNQNQMNESWHIPRASLAGSSMSTPSSSNSSNKSHSNPSTVSRNFKIANDSSATGNSSNSRKLQNIDHRQRRADSKSNMLHHGTPHRVDGVRGGRLGGRQSLSTSRNNVNNKNNNNNTQTPKRGSHSSQGSSDSNNSSQSISSGSLLLTAANLERFAEIHKKQNYNNNNKHELLNSNYNTNLMLASMSSPSNLTNKDAVISIEQNLDFVKTKDMDTVSMASSTHFTMVNGEGGPSRKTSGGGICSRGKQVTVLITTMSLLFLIVIIGMVYALELRAREMPKS